MEHKLSISDYKVRHWEVTRGCQGAEIHLLSQLGHDAVLQHQRRQLRAPGEAHRDNDDDAHDDDDDMTGAAGAGLHRDPGLSRLGVSEASDRVSARDNKQELRMRSVPGSGQVRVSWCLIVSRMPCVRNESLRDNINAAKTLVIILIVFFVCWFPFFLTYILPFVGKVSRESRCA